MGFKPLKIIIYGIFPTVYSTCAPCCSYDYFSTCKPGYSDEQISEYPDWVLEQQDFMVKLLGELSRFGRWVRVEVVSGDSIRGVYVALRYKVGKGPAVIVGNRVFKGEELSIENIVNYVGLLIKGGEKPKISTTAQ